MSNQVSGAVTSWVTDSMHNLLGYSDAATAEYIVARALAASSPDALVARLADDGLSDGDLSKMSRLQAFAVELMAKVAPSQEERKKTVARERNRQLIAKIKEAERYKDYQLVGTGTQPRGKRKSKGVLEASKNDSRHGNISPGSRDATHKELSRAESSESRRERKEQKRMRRERRERESSVVDGSTGHRTGIHRRRKASDVKEGNGEFGEGVGYRKGLNSSDLEIEEEEQDSDIRERDAFAERLRKRDKGEQPEKVDTLGGDAHEGDGDATQEYQDDAMIDRLRVLSRQSYLKKREVKELERLREEIEDELYIFEGQKLSERERSDLALKQELYRLASTRVYELREEDPDNPGHKKRVARYRMPDAFGDLSDKKTDKEKKMEALTARFEDADDMQAVGKVRKPTTEQAKWEEEQLRKVHASSEYSVQDQASIDVIGKTDGKVYNLVADSIEFVESDRIPDTGGDRYLSGGVRAAFHAPDPNLSAMKAKRLEDIKRQRESLPMFQYRNALIDAVRRYQVLVVVSETGSGKTTQIPQYLVEDGFSRVACTQPRRVAAMSVAARVAHEMNVKLGSEVGYSIRFEDCTSTNTAIKYLTDGMLLREFLSEPDLASYDVVMIDEAHERSLSTDIVMGLVKDIARFRGDNFRVIISSATLNAEKLSGYFDNAPVFKIPGRMYGVDILFSKVPQADYLDACCVTVLQIHKSQPPGDILVFLTGQDEIEEAEESLRVRTRGLGSKLGELIIAPIYSTLPSDLQAKIFEPTPPRARKVVLATNIAETSVTIPGIVYVIDPGFCKQKSCNSKTGMESLLVVPVSQAGAIQRAGRAGRTQPGKCFRLYTKWSFQNEMETDTVPEILRTNLAQVVLTLMSLGIDNLIEFDFIDAPPMDALARSLEQLYALGALNDRGQLTKLGRRMAELPLDPMMAKALLASETYKCSEEVATICAMLSVNNAIFYRPKEKKVLADAAHSAFSRGGGGDHIKLLNCFNQWRDSGYSTQWCYENYVQARTLKKARDVRDQLDGLLERVEVTPMSAGVGNWESILKAITAGFFYHGCKLQKNGLYRTLKNPHTVQIHPSSCLAKTEMPPLWLIYHELVFTSKEYMRQVFAINSRWLLEVAPHYYEEKDLEDESLRKRKMPKKMS